MTLNDTMDKENAVQLRSSKTMGHFLMLCVKQATRRDSLHCGMASCAQLLKTDPASVMFCVLPASCDKLSMQIHHTLIKAFCQERKIPVFLIKEERHLATLIRKVAGKRRCNKVKGDVEDMNCVLIQHSTKSASKFDRELMQHYNEYMANGMPVPAVDVPA